VSEQSSDSDSRRPSPARSRLVEGVRLIFVVLLATAGYQIGTQSGPQSTARTALFVFLGSLVGYVAGGILGRLTARTVSGMERDLRRAPAATLVAGSAGLIIGLLVAALVSVPMFRLPAAAAWPAIVFVYLTLGSLGFSIARAKANDLFALFGLKPRAAAADRGVVTVIDTSALIDGRVGDLVTTGFLDGVLLLHEGVLRELQTIADSSDPRRRTRGRRGLDVLAEIQRAPTVEVSLVEEAGAGDVDAALVRLARERGASLLTVDANLAKVAEATGVSVRQVNQLATAMRPPFVPGDEMLVHLVKEGRDHGQAIGYLDDGTMVVVESARERLGEDVPVRVTNMIQTSTGRMVFASVAEGPGAPEVADVHGN
jgi:uncharacterized protein YacL